MQTIYCWTLPNRCVRVTAEFKADLDERAFASLWLRCDGAKTLVSFSWPFLLLLFILSAMSLVTSRYANCSYVSLGVPKYDQQAEPE